MKALTLKSVGFSIAVAIGSLFTVSASADEILFSNVLPTFEAVRDVSPVYPQRAIDRRVSGYSLVEYTINASGRVDNVKVVDSDPAKIFNKASKRAILRTVYDKADAASVQGNKFYRMYVYELDETNANALAALNQAK